jgi:catechol 2,3-dioxygenase-like lactoylglutathione lyase family enzyme
MALKNPTKLFPMILTSRLEDTKRFYTEVLGARVVFDLPTYLQVAFGEGDAPELGFMKPDAFPDGKARPAFGGAGVLVSIPTQSADTFCAEVQKRGGEIIAPLTDKPWGWRSFFTQDPNGVVLDFFHVYQEHPM